MVIQNFNLLQQNIVGPPPRGHGQCTWYHCTFDDHAKWQVLHVLSLTTSLAVAHPYHHIFHPCRCTPVVFRESEQQAVGDDGCGASWHNSMG